MCNYTTASLITSLTMQRKYITLEPSGGWLKCDCSVSKGFVWFFLYFHGLYFKIVYQQRVAPWIIQEFVRSRITDVDSGISKWKFSCTTPEIPFRFYFDILMPAGLPAVPLADAVCWRLLSSVFLRLTAILIDTPPASIKVEPFPVDLLALAHFSFTSVACSLYHSNCCFALYYPWHAGSLPPSIILVALCHLRHCLALCSAVFTGVSGQARANQLASSAELMTFSPEM